MRVLEAALSYAARGWRVLPVRNKIPLTAHGVKDATTDQEKIKTWFTRWPDAGVGIAAGIASGLVVLDIDAAKDGLESLAQLETEHGPLPTTLKVKTGGGGFHFYFIHPGGRIRNRANMFPGVDLRSDNGYVVAPPSLHASGNKYAWVEGCSPNEIEIAELHQWLLLLIDPPKAEPVAPLPVNRTPGDLEDAIEAMRNIKTLDQSDGSRRLFAYTCRCVEQNLSDADAIAAINVMQSERPFPQTWGTDAIVARLRDAEKTVVRGSEASTCSLWRREGRTDISNSKFFTKLFGEDFKWCDAWKCWMHFDGTRWIRDSQCEVQTAAKHIGARRWVEAARIVESPSADDSLKKQAVAFAKYSNSAAGVSNLLALAKSE
ncbi:MAG TPA: bifunctional DNA primase/polymerase [Pirellulales bacterium]|jgi:hypothetical protein|nr:bifunctional DNA primase/polymerase [Pirellulales bacterium]